MYDKYDDKIKKALILFEEKELSSLPEEDEIGHRFTEKHIKKINKLIKKAGMYRYSFINTAAKKAAVFIICLILACSSLLTVEAAREKVVGFFYKVYSTYTEIINDNKPKRNEFIKNYYMIPTVPKDYTLCIETTNEFNLYRAWANAENKTITFEQAILNSPPKLNSEKTSVIETIINDSPCIYIKQDTIYIYYWEFNNYRFLLIYPIGLGEEYAETVIGKLVEITE